MDALSELTRSFIKEKGLCLEIVMICEEPVLRKAEDGSSPSVFMISVKGILRDCGI